MRHINLSVCVCVRAHANTIYLFRFHQGLKDSHFSSKQKAFKFIFLLSNSLKMLMILARAIRIIQQRIKGKRRLPIKEPSSNASQALSPLTDKVSQVAS